MADDESARAAFDRAAYTTHDAYREQVGSIFRMEDVPEGPIPLQLASVSEARVSGGFLQFSLFFHGPSARLLPQGIYAFVHDTLGTLALFIVPILGSNRERIVYEASFNRRPAAGDVRAAAADV